MKDITAMAREAWGEHHEIFWFDYDGIEKFAALVRADAIAGERNSWPAEMEAMERQVNILTDALTQSRKPLTVDEIVEIADRHLDVGDGERGATYVYGEIEFARAIEAAHGIKENT